MNDSSASVPHSKVKEYLSRIGIRKISELDTALIEFGRQEEGARHI